MFNICINIERSKMFYINYVVRYKNYYVHFVPQNNVLNIYTNNVIGDNSHDIKINNVLHYFTLLRIFYEIKDK